MQILTYLHDPDDLYIDLINSLNLPNELSNGVISVSPSTTKNIKKMVKELPYERIIGGLYGESRIKLVKYAVENINSDYYLLCDFDKLVHWINTDLEELIRVTNLHLDPDVTVIARSSRALSTYPDTWIQTESIATQIMAKILKKKVDFMNGPLILNKHAVEVIANEALEQNVGSCSEFCLIANKAKLTIDNLEVDGLTWEDPDRYTKLIKQARSYDDWKYDTYYSLYEWRKRVEFLNIQVETMIRFEKEPINPKYPLVHNKTLETTESN